MQQLSDFQFPSSTQAVKNYIASQRHCLERHLTFFEKLNEFVCLPGEHTVALCVNHQLERRMITAPTV